MLIITIQVDAPTGQAIGIKEQAAMLLEGLRGVKAVRVVEIREDKQMSML